MIPPTTQILLKLLADRGRLAIEKSLRTTDPRKYAKYRREAEGYADLCAMLEMPFRGWSVAK